MPCLNACSLNDPLLMLRLPHLQSDDDEVPIAHIPPRSALALFDADHAILIPLPCPSSSSCPPPRHRPALQTHVALADALWSMVQFDLLLLLLDASTTNRYGHGSVSAWKPITCQCLGKLVTWDRIDRLGFMITLM
jgi:hypothetical protein